MTDHNPLPSCPYCGEHMGLECNTKNMYWYECYKCGATTPQEGAEQAAYEAAMNRWQEPNRVLTMDEIIDKVFDAVCGMPVWIEHINDTEKKLAWKFSGWKVVRGAGRCVLIFGTGHSVSTENINKTWRCWLRKPTAEEMATTPWESKKENEK